MSRYSDKHNAYKYKGTRHGVWVVKIEPGKPVTRMDYGEV